jgi:hypothetical protein
MMMKMLEAGGIAPVQDGVRSADTNNPRGYYEFERVKQLDKGDVAWLAQVQGKSVKVISALLHHLPAEYDYRILFMRRNLDEVLASQSKMLASRHEEKRVSDDEMKQLYRQHLQQVERWVRRQPNMQLYDVPYHALVREPMEYLPDINTFLDGRLGVLAAAMAVDPTLYRNRNR